MAYGIYNHLSYRPDWKFVPVFSYQSINLGTMVDMSKHKLVCRFNLLV